MTRGTKRATGFTAVFLGITIVMGCTRDHPAQTATPPIAPVVPAATDSSLPAPAIDAANQASEWDENHTADNDRAPRPAGLPVYCIQGTNDDDRVYLLSCVREQSRCDAELARMRELYRDGTLRSVTLCNPTDALWCFQFETGQRRCASFQRQCEQYAAAQRAPHSTCVRRWAIGGAPTSPAPN